MRTLSVRDSAENTSQTSLEIRQPATCNHTETEDLTWGRKHKYKALRCKQCGIILQMEPL